MLETITQDASPIWNITKLIGFETGISNAPITKRDFCIESCQSSNVSIWNRYSSEPYTKSMFERKKKPWHLNGYKTTSVLMPAMRLLSNIRTGLLIWNPCRVNLHKNGVDHRSRGGRPSGGFNTFHSSHKFGYKTRATFTVTVLGSTFRKTPKTNFCTERCLSIASNW